MKLGFILSKIVNIFINSRLAVYTLLKSAGIDKAGVKAYSSLPLAYFKCEADVVKASTLLPNLIQNRKMKNTTVSAKVTFYMDDILIVPSDKAVNVVRFIYPRMFGVLQLDNLILSEVSHPAASLNIPKPGGEIYVTFFNYGAWILKKETPQYWKMAEHYRMMSNCMEVCCYDETNKVKRTMKEKLNLYFETMETAGSF